MAVHQNSDKNKSDLIQLKKGELFLLPTRAIENFQNEPEEDFSDFSSEEELINEENVAEDEEFVENIAKHCDNLGYDLDGRLQPDDVVFESYLESPTRLLNCGFEPVDRPELGQYRDPTDLPDCQINRTSKIPFQEAANFSPFVVVGEPSEVESIVLWDYFGGTTYSDLNVTAGDTVFVVAEEYQTRCITANQFIRLPFQWSLSRWITGRPVDPYLGLLPSHYLVPKKFYQENPLLFKHPVWFHSNNEVDEVLRLMFSDRSALCPGLFAIFSPPWLNPNPKDLRCYFLIVLVERSVVHDQTLMQFLAKETKNASNVTNFLDDKLATAIEDESKLKGERNAKAIDFLCEIEATPYSPAIFTITRSQLGHFEFMSKRYETLFDLVYYLANHRSTLPHKLVYNRMSPDVVSPQFVPPPVRRFEKNLKAQPMTVEQWAGMHFDEVTSLIEQTDKFSFVSKSLFDGGKKNHERMLKRLDIPPEEKNQMLDYVNEYIRPKTNSKKRNNKKPKSEKTNNGKKKKKPWTDLPLHQTAISIKSPFYINLDRVKCKNVSLGSGAFGSVEVGSFSSSPLESIPVAVKKLKLLPNMKEERNLAFSEIEILQMVAHPNVVLFHGYSIDNKTQNIFLLFELMDMSLDKFVEKSNGKISENEKLDLLAQICRGMSYLHTRTPSVVHGDLAARNVLLKKHPMNTSRYIAKITDLGLAKLCRDELYTSYNDPNKIPFKWLPPEVLGARILTAKADVWAFGMVCFEIYGIGDPYGILPTGKVLQYLNDGYRFDKLPGMSPCILEIAYECWRKQAVDRPCFGDLERRLLDYVIEYDEEDEIIPKEREKEMLTSWKMQKRKQKIGKIIEGNMQR